MKWSVIQLQKLREHALEIDEVIDVTENLKQRDSEIVDLTPVHVKGKAYVDSQKVTFHLQLSGTFTLPCARTLADVKYPIDVRSIESFLFKPLDYELGDSEVIHEIDGGMINLIPVVEELLLLEIPLQVFCDEVKDQDAKLAGNGWEVMTEEQLKLEQEKQKKKIDPRLAGLAELLKDNKEK